MSIGIQEILIILVALIILFGGNRIPELARVLGRASYEFKKAKNAIKKELDEMKEEIEIQPETNKIKDNSKEF